MSRIYLLLWAIVVIEILSPIPAFLSFGAAYILAFRPTWFRDMVLELYR